MYKFSDLSERRMEGVDNRLITLMRESLRNSPVDFGVAWLGGKRTAKQQNSRYVKGYSQKDGYKRISKHQTGHAIDVLPYVHGEPVTDDKYYYIIIGVIMATAKHMGIAIRNGGDWDQDGEYVTDQKLKDLGHFELLNI
jgi:peptidoglycan L-alanyl-D-glutamate endopeptidase CwlK